MPSLVFDAGGYGAVFLALLAVSGLSILSQRLQRHRQGLLYYSRVSDLQFPKESWRVRLAHLPQTLLVIALALFLLALLDPRIEMPLATVQNHGITRVQPTEGIAIYLLLDQSGSMSQNRKMETLKEATRAFISSRENDLIGLITFARYARVLSPLTLDRQALLKQLDDITVVTDPSQDGTDIGYTLFKTVNLIAATRHFAKQLAAEHKTAYTIKNAIMVLVTDGFQSPNPLDKGHWLRTMGMEEAAEYAQANHVRLYLINIEPLLGQEEFAPHRHLLEKITHLTGGKFFLSASPSDIEQIYDQINQLEKSALPEGSLIAAGRSNAPIPTRIFPLFSLFISAGLCALGGAILLGTTSLRQVP